MLVNLSFLALSVALAESGLGKSPASQQTHNIVSIMEWTDGKRHLKVFPSKGQSLAAFRALWLSKYSGGLPTERDAQAYVGTSDASHWRQVVLASYQKYMAGK